LPSFFKRKDSPASAQPLNDPMIDEAGPVQAARARARRRLIGAVVLLAIGVLVFPMLFETQPRPLPRDIPIELPRREGAAPKAPIAARNAPSVTELPVAEPALPASGAVAVVAEAPPSPAAEPPSAARTPLPAPPEPKAAVAKPEPPRAEPAKSEPSKAEAIKAVERPAPDSKKTDAERARAALEGRSDDRSDAPASASADAVDVRAGRFVVQVGAYTDAATLRDVRAKVEKLGLKTYTQVVETEAGKRTRVRVGPFATRQEADSASGKLKAAGLPGNVLVL
jgi:DedD protein